MSIHGFLISTIMKIAYQDKLRLSRENTVRLEQINEIIEDYRAQGFIMTLRQLYYQLVRRNVIPNVAAEYAKLSNLLKKGRMAGIVDWSAIEDRGRRPRLPYWVTGIPDALNDTAEAYRLDRMRGQEKYIEIWVEKDALSNVLDRVTDPYHVNLMVNKGYSSCSAMHEAYQRFYRTGKPGVILYFGDHDPSGKDMVRDIENRFHEFGYYDFEIENPALNIDQIRRYNLPPNPAKLTDPRAGEYIAKYGRNSWELDALEPPVLIQIVTDALLNHIDEEKYEMMLALEELEKGEVSALRDMYNTSDDE